jgi:hypothetical protein
MISQRHGKQWRRQEDIVSTRKVGYKASPSTTMMLERNEEKP